MAGQEGEADQGQDVVDRVVMLGDPERPADHRPIGRREGVGGLPDRLGRDAGLALGVGERVRLDVRPVGLEAGGGVVDERLVLEPGLDDLAGHRVGQGDVAADIETEPQIGPFGGRRSARVDRDEPGPAVDALQQVVEEDRVGLAGIAAPQEDEIRLLDLTV